MNIPVSKAKAQFSELIRRVEMGEEIVLTRNGKPVARLSVARDTLSPGEKARLAAGSLKDRIHIAEDFDELGPEWDEYVR